MILHWLSSFWGLETMLAVAVVALLIAAWFLPDDDD